MSYGESLQGFPTGWLASGEKFMERAASAGVRGGRFASLGPDDYQHGRLDPPDLLYPFAQLLKSSGGEAGRCCYFQYSSLSLSLLFHQSALSRIVCCDIRLLRGAGCFRTIRNLWM